MRHMIPALAILLYLGTTAPAHAAVEAESAYIFNTLLLLLSGMLVMFMAAGFAMLESGLVRSGSVTTILTKNIALYAIAGIMYFLFGYNLMYHQVDGGYIGTLAFWQPDDDAAQRGDFTLGHAAAADWFFQMAFVATAASVVSGTLAERIKLWPFLLFTTILTGFFYPITGAWKWGGGWLEVAGFKDFAGSTLVHSVGGWAALTGAIFLGARAGRYSPQGKVTAFPGSNLPLATLGTFILWLGWFGFNGGSQLAMGSGADAIAIARIVANTNMAAAGGLIAAMLLTCLSYRKVDLTMALNGALAGLVSITAEPLTPTLGQALCIGVAGGALVMVAVPLLDRLRIDDVVGAIPVHLVCGIWGTLAVPLTNPEASFAAQFLGVAAVAGFTLAASAALWWLLKRSIGIRLSREQEYLGSDAAELGMSAYPEFIRSQVK